MKVLIADDELVTRTVMARAASHAGHEVATACDGRDLVQKYLQFRPEVLFVDWQMPVLNGVDAIREVRELPGGEDAFVILATVVSGDTETAKALDAGIDDYLLKPISVPRMRVLLTLTEARIAARRQRDGKSGKSASGPSLREILACCGAVIAVDTTGRITYASAEIDGRPSTDFLGGTAQSVFGDAFGKFSECGRQAQATNQPQSFSVNRGPGQETWTVQAVRRDGDVVGTVAFCPTVVRVESLKESA